MNPLAVLWEYREGFLGGLWTTCELVGICTIAGTLLAIILELVCQQLGRGARRLVDGVAFCIAAIPALVILFWLYYPAQETFGVVISPFWTAAAALLLMNSFAVYRIIADAVRDFPRQFVATGMVCGLTASQIVLHIQAPLLMRASLPRWIDQQVVILQTSLFASLISVEETFRVAQRINSIVYQPVVIYTAMALLFLLIAGSAMYYAGKLRERFDRDFSER